MSRIFIDRPIFAWVIAIIIMLAGIGAIFTLPIAQFPTSRRRRSTSAPPIPAPRPRR
jgi:multidrug efflux pump subunit AcrB